MPSLRDIMASKAAGASAPAAKAAGLKLSDTTPPGKADPAPSPLMTAPGEALLGRRLDQTSDQADHLPMDWPSETSSLDEKLWWQARHLRDRDLVIWIEPESEGARRAWIAAQSRRGPLILITPLPLSSNPGPGDPF